ncbi:hypothetical protein GGF32_006931, partial [Allomyces javanicus]
MLLALCSSWRPGLDLNRIWYVLVMFYNDNGYVIPKDMLGLNSMVSYVEFLAVHTKAKLVQHGRLAAWVEDALICPLPNLVCNDQRFPRRNQVHGQQRLTQANGGLGVALGGGRTGRRETAVTAVIVVL